MEGNWLVKYCLPMDEEVFNTVALQTSGFGVAELYNPGSWVWDGNWARANGSRWTRQCPAEALPWCAPTSDSTGSCHPRLREALAPWPSPLHLVTSPAALPASRIHPVSSSTVCCAKDDAEVSWYHCQPVPWHLPQGRAQDASQPSVEPG